MGVNRSLVKSFFYALEGIREALKEEPNFKIQALAALLAIILALFLGLSSVEWIILIFTITFVLVLELINTIIEGVLNLASPGISREAKIAKDMMAGAVLLGAIFSVIVGVILFLPKILLLF